jgi:hypothetical protein
VRRGRFKRDLRIGRLRGACKTINRRARLFRAGTRSGTYRVTFDGSRRYSTRTRPSVLFRVRIFRIRISKARVVSVSEG